MVSGILVVFYVCIVVRGGVNTTDQKTDDWFRKDSSIRSRVVVSNSCMFGGCIPNQ